MPPYGRLRALRTRSQHAAAAGTSRRTSVPAGPGPPIAAFALRAGLAPSRCGGAAAPPAGVPGLLPAMSPGSPGGWRQHPAGSSVLLCRGPPVPAGSAPATGERSPRPPVLHCGGSTARRSGAETAAAPNCPPPVRELLRREACPRTRFSPEGGLPAVLPRRGRSLPAEGRGRQRWAGAAPQPQ